MLKNTEKIYPKSVSIINNNQVYNIGTYIPPELIRKEGEQLKNYVMLLAPRREDQIPTDGEEVFLIGQQYSVFNKQYDLSSGFGIRACLFKGCIIPILRASRGFEYVAPCRIERNNRQITITTINSLGWPDIKNLTETNLTKETLHPEVYSLLEGLKYI